MGKKQRNNNICDLQNELSRSYLSKSYEIQINMIKSSIDYYESMRNSYYEQEPLKIFKNKHKEWKEKIKEIDNKILKFCNQLEVMYDDYKDLFNTKKKK